MHHRCLIVSSFLTIGPASNNDSRQDSKSSSATTPNPLPFPILTPERPQMSYAAISKMMEQYHRLDSARNEATSSPSVLEQFRDHVSHLFKLLKRKIRDEPSNESSNASSDDLAKCLFSFEHGIYSLALKALDRFKDADLKVVVSSEVINTPNLLHLATMNGWVDIMETLIKKHGFDPMSKDTAENVPLHYSAYNCHFEAFKVLVTIYHCDPLWENFTGRTPLCFAVKVGCIEIVEHYMTSGLPCDGNTRYVGKPLGILAAENGRLKMLKYLKEECNFDVSSSCSEGNTALDYAAQSGCLHIAKYLVSKCNCNPDAYKHWFQKKPLHHASERGQINIVKYLIVECKCDVHCVAKGLTPLQYAALNGHFEIVKYFIEEHECIPESALRYAAEHGSIDMVVFLAEKCQDDSEYDQSLDAAIKGKHLDVVKYLMEQWRDGTDLSNSADLSQRLFSLTCSHSFYQVDFLINVCHVNPSAIDGKGRTLLHHAVEKITNEHGLMVVQCLLATGKIDTLKKDNNNETPLAIAHRKSASFKKEVELFFNAFGRAKTLYPVESYVNVLIVGNRKAGKSTLSKVIEKTATGYNLSEQLGDNEVKPDTAGIIPMNIKHRQLQNIVLHDFAGHSEYYMSHSAVIENLLQGSAAVIIIVVDVSLSDCVAQLEQWLTVMGNEITRAEKDCRVIVVASHIDCLSDEDKKETLELMKFDLKGRGDIEFLDCRRLRGERLNSFLTTLQNACKHVRQNDQRHFTLYCHVMYKLLQESKKEILTLHDIATEAVEKDVYLFLPINNGKEVLNILSSLHSTGLIYYLNCENDKNLWQSDISVNGKYTYEVKKDIKLWVIKNKQILLAKVNGILFDQKTFKRDHPKVVENGIIPVSSIIKHFPDYDPIMLISFFENMGLCHLVSPLFLLNTNLVTKEEFTTEDIYCLFFPSLIESGRPEICDDFNFGWCLQCVNAELHRNKELHGFLSQRFFNALLLHLAAGYSTRDASALAESVLNCRLWKNGMKWCDQNNIVTVVELVDADQCILVLMSCEENARKLMVSLRRELIKDIETSFREYCTGVKAEGFVIDPDCLEYPIDKPIERTVYSVENLKGKGKDIYVQPTNARGTRRGKRVCDILPDEPDYDKLSIFGEDVEVRVYFVINNYPFIIFRQRTIVTLEMLM